MRATRREIGAAVAQHRDWIFERQRANRERWQRRLARRFDDGDRVPFLGRTLRLVVREGGAASVREGDDLVVFVAANVEGDMRRGAAREAVGRWLLAQAQDVFHERHVAASRAVGASAVAVSIKDMRSRWGSCGSNRRMSLNWRLIMAPLEIIDYVLVHELTHIEIPNHSARFWRAVGEACPHWRESRDWLRIHGADLEL